MLNHAEKSFDMETLEVTIRRADKVGLATIVLLFVKLRARDAPYLLTRSTALLPPPAALVSLPLAGARVQIFSDPPTKKGHQKVSFSLAEKERFEFSN